MTPWYIATERFSPDSGGAWDKFVDWSGLDHLDEVVSLDPMLSPSLFHHDSIPDDHWPHIVNEDYLLDFFVDLPFLLAQVDAIGGRDDCNLLAVYRNPESHPSAPPADGDLRFEFLGYDLVDTYRSASALTNCGGFPEAFDGRELNPFGLLPSFERAVAVRASLREAYPDEAHADCHLWAIFRGTRAR